MVYAGDTEVILSTFPETNAAAHCGEFTEAEKEAENGD
jgi:hypothetical protein